MKSVGQMTPGLRVVVIGIALIIVDFMNGLGYALHMGLDLMNNVPHGSSGAATANYNGVSDKKEL